MQILLRYDINDPMEPTVDFLHEVGMLAHTPRSGFAFLGTGKQSVAEHTHRMTFIAYALARRHPDPINLHRLLMICLCHDLPEARTSDLNYVNKQYVKVDINQAIEDIRQSNPLGPEVAEFIEEYEKGETLEAILAHDADQLELMLVLKNLQELGNERTKDWMANVMKRIKTSVAIELAEQIQKTPSTQWWMKKLSE